MLQRIAIVVVMTEIEVNPIETDMFKQVVEEINPSVNKLFKYNMTIDMKAKVVHQLFLLIVLKYLHLRLFIIKDE